MLSNKLSSVCADVSWSLRVSLSPKMTHETTNSNHCCTTDWMTFGRLLIWSILRGHPSRFHWHINSTVSELTQKFIPSNHFNNSKHSPIITQKHRQNSFDKETQNPKSPVLRKLMFSFPAGHLKIVHWMKIGDSKCAIFLASFPSISITYPLYTNQIYFKPK